ncbi:MAG: DNA mismatch endonuclease Vsr [Marinomonas sp.]
MVDTISSDRRSENMRRIRSKNSKPELLVRRLVHSLGYRYRLHRSDLPGKPDLTFGPKRKVVFVHGCFWHQHTAKDCLDGRRPKSNTDYWNKKLERNVDRGRKNLALFRNLGWDVLIVWECETVNLEQLQHRLITFLGER